MGLFVVSHVLSQRVLADKTLYAVGQFHEQSPLGHGGHRAVEHLAHVRLHVLRFLEVVRAALGGHGYLLAHGGLRGGLGHYLGVMLLDVRRAFGQPVGYDAMYL